MPTRLVREGYLSSAAVDQLDAQSERFYFRLYLVVDDYGRFEFRPELIKSSCFPVKTSVRVSDITRWIAACVRAGLIVIYEHDGREYICVLKFGQRTRRASKCPAPPGETPMTADCGLDEGGCEGGCEGVFGDGDADATETTRSPSTKSKPPPKQKLSFDPVAIWCDEYQKKYHLRPPVDGKDAAQAHRLARLTKGPEEWRAVIRSYLSDNTPRVVSLKHPLAWISTGKNRYFGDAQEEIGRRQEEQEFDDGSDTDQITAADIEAARIAKQKSARASAV